MRESASSIHGYLAIDELLQLQIAAVEGGVSKKKVGSQLALVAVHEE